MWSNATQLEGSLYDPNSKIINFLYEDFEEIRLKAVREERLYVDNNFVYPLLEGGKDWKRPGEICDTPYFIKNQTDRFDAFQGDIEDSWLITAMQVLSMNNNLIRHVVPHGQTLRGIHYIGAFHFRIWRLGTWYDVVVDDHLPVWKHDNKLCNAYSRSGDVFWACLLEKAYAKFCGLEYGNLTHGHPTTALQDFSGGIVESFFTTDPPSGTTLKWFINRVFAYDALMCCSVFENEEARNHFMADAYSITNVFMCADDDPTYPGLYILRILSPHGVDEWSGEWSDNSSRWREIDRETRRILNVEENNDGEFWMSENDFAECFSRLSVCHLGPGQFVQSRKVLNWNEKVDSWKTTTIMGEWLNQVSAGGSDRSTRHLNPQYRLEFTRSDNNTNTDNYVSVVVELTQRDKYDRRLKRNIRFYLYSLYNVSDLPTPLDYDFFQSNNALNENEVYFILGTDRSYATRFELDIDTMYCIVPCTEYADEETQFLLRIWTESSTQMWEYDTKISKSLPNKEESLRETNNGLRAMFDDLADSRNEVDWVTLKIILEKSMNTNQNYFANIKRFYKLIWDLLDIFLSRSSHDDNETGEIVFSKDACRSMIAMLDDDRSGKINFTEFSHLWNKICVWTKIYNQHTDVTEGCMKVSQLREALSSMGYNLNKKIIHVLIHFYADEQENINLVDFILCGVNLETGISLYQKKDVKEDKMTFTLEEWLKNTLFL